MLFKVTCRCVRCGNRWIYRTKHPDRPDPPCPNLDCGLQGEPIGMDLTLNKAPAAIGGNIAVKAIDETAKIVMEDYGMTNLRSDVRETESAAPKLSTPQQTMADAYFGGGRSGRSGMPIVGMPGVTLGDLGGGTAGKLSRAVAFAKAGALSNAATTEASIGAVHRHRLRPNTEIVATERGPA